MTPFPAYAPGETIVLANARIPRALLRESLPMDPDGRDEGAGVTVDIALSNGLVDAIARHDAGPPALAAATAEASAGPSAIHVHDCRGGLVFPAFVDLHTHLDKGHIWPRKENPDGTFMGALDSVRADRTANWSAADVARRMDFSLRAAFAHGTAAVRTHIDSTPPQDAISWPVLAEMRERWAGRIELQGVALMGPDDILDPRILSRVAARAKSFGGILGGAISLHPEAGRAVRTVVEAAGAHGLDLDLHIDESDDPASTSLRALAEAVHETGYARRVVAGHCCSLAVQDSAAAEATIARVAEAKIAVVSLPMCNLYLQDRHNLQGRHEAGAVRTPRWRGVTLVNELKAAGVEVALSSDNTRDPFYAYGDMDGLEVLREGARIAHLDHPQEGAFDWARAVTATPAALGGFTYGGEIAPGLPADLVLFSARTWTELMARPQADRIVLRAGRAIDRTLPDFRELDDLMER